jgi:hypothetical protein
MCVLFQSLGSGCSCTFPTKSASSSFITDSQHGRTSLFQLMVKVLKG